MTARDNWMGELEGAKLELDRLADVLDLCTLGGGDAGMMVSALDLGAREAHRIANVIEQALKR